MIRKELEAEVRERLSRIKRSVLEPTQGASFSTALNLRKKYASMTAVEVVQTVFSKAEELLRPQIPSTYKVGERHKAGVFQEPKRFFSGASRELDHWQSGDFVFT